MGFLSKRRSRRMVERFRSESPEDLVQELVFIRLALGGNPQPYGDLVLATAICQERGINVEKHVYEGLGSGWGPFAALEWAGARSSVRQHDAGPHSQGEGLCRRSHTHVRSIT
jgi:hypothetical protein